MLLPEFSIYNDCQCHNFGIHDLVKTEIIMI